MRDGLRSHASGEKPDMEQSSPAASLTRARLFLAFLEIGLCGFGGVAPWARWVIVEKRRWLTEENYAELLGIASILPGANTVNLAVMFGDRACGISGSLCALAGLLFMPLAILVALAAAYDRFSSLPEVRHALAGAAAATAGLVIATAAKMMRNLRPDAIGLVSGLVVLVAAGFLRFPLAGILVIAVPAAMAARALFARMKAARK
jgi:chromate transporter